MAPSVPLRGSCLWSRVAELWSLGHLSDVISRLVTRSGCQFPHLRRIRLSRWFQIVVVRLPTRNGRERVESISHHYQRSPSRVQRQRRVGCASSKGERCRGVADLGRSALFERRFPCYWGVPVKTLLSGHNFGHRSLHSNRDLWICAFFAERTSITANSTGSCFYRWLLSLHFVCQPSPSDSCSKTLMFRKV